MKPSMMSCFVRRVSTIMRYRRSSSSTGILTLVKTRSIVWRFPMTIGGSLVTGTGFCLGGASATVAAVAARATGAGVGSGAGWGRTAAAGPTPLASPFLTINSSSRLNPSGRRLILDPLLVQRAVENTPQLGNLGCGLPFREYLLDRATLYHRR